MFGVGEADLCAVGDGSGGTHFDIFAGVEERKGPGFYGAFEDARVEPVADLIVGALDAPHVAVFRTPGGGVVEYVFDSCGAHFQFRVAGRADDREYRDIAVFRALRPEGDRAVGCDADIAVRRRKVYRRAAAGEP